MPQSKTKRVVKPTTQVSKKRNTTRHTSKQPCPRRSTTPNINNSTENITQQNFKVNSVVAQGPRKKADLKYIQAVAEDLVRWARVPDVLTIEEFYDYIDVVPDMLSLWAHKHKCIAIALKKANTMIGARREVGLIRKKYDRYVASTLHNYLPRCKKSDLFHADIKAKADSKVMNEELILRIFKDAQKDTKSNASS